MTEATQFTVAEVHLHFAKSINGRVWELLGKAGRSQAESEEMLYAAYASTYHWLYAGTLVHRQRGEWLISHVYVVLGNAQEAVRHAERCRALTEAHRAEMKDFDIAFAYEGLARAQALAGDQVEARRFLELAQRAGEAIANAEDRSIFTGDFKGGDWYGLK